MITTLCLCQIKLLSELEMGPMLALTFYVSRICITCSISWTSSLREPPIWRQILLLKHLLAWRSMRPYERGESHDPVRRGNPLYLTICKADPHPASPTLLDFSCPKVLTPSSRCPHPSRSWLLPRGSCLSVSPSPFIVFNGDKTIFMAPLNIADSLCFAVVSPPTWHPCSWDLVDLSP